MTTRHPDSFGARRRWATSGRLLVAVLLAWQATSLGAGPRFLRDDPLQREPDSQDASGVQPWDINLFYDLSYHLFVTPRLPVVDVRAGNVNTIDEVPDSSWFTNRIGVRPLSDEELVRGPNVGPPPDPSRWTLIREKTSGFSPGFTARDARGETWFLSFDAPSNPEGASGALMVATRLFWALGYNQVEYFLTEVHGANLQIDPAARTRRPNRARTPVNRADVDAVLARSAKNATGAHRAAAGRALTGRILGGFRYYGTRPDDPNDIVPHEQRRELRALRVFGAWTNLTDMKSGNTLDTLVTEGGRGVVKHYLQDVGSAFGIGAQGPHDWSEGWEHTWDGPPVLRRLLTFGFAFSPWQTARYQEYPAVGRFEGDEFDPETWKPHAPTAAYFAMRDDDAFWAARRVMAFSDAAIRTVVGTAAFSDPRAAAHLADVLIKRRDTIGRTYLPNINPIVEPVLDAAGRLSFGNAAVDHGVATPPRRYTAVWHAFDNVADTATRIAESTNEAPRLDAPPGLPSATGSFVRVDVAAEHPDHPSWSRPVEVYFRKDPGGWVLVGLERMKDGA